MSASKTVKIIVDGRELEVDASTNVLQAALGHGINVPYFCWHPELGSVGACRQCAVIQYKDETDTQGRMVMSCMTPCSDRARFSVDHPDAKDMRASVVEFLMTNHPHDCPVCEEGGHCHLQDMTVMTGHNYRRYRHSKRTHRNQELGPFIGHEMNRCIACYRCVRYYKDYAGGKDLDQFGSAANMYFGRAEDGTLESEFSGNLVEVCPTGVFTDKPYGDSYTRKWDLQTSPSICTHCSIGCNISPGERYGKLKRIENRYHGEINGYFICDRGRYGAGFVNREDRPRVPLQNGKLVGHDRALELAAGWLKAGRVLGIGSPRAALESNHALRELVGEKNFHNGQSAQDAAATALGIDILRKTPGRIASVRDAESADAVLVLGEDVSNTGARLALALRQSTRQAGMKQSANAHIPLWQDASVRTMTQDLLSPLYIATPAATRLDEIAAGTLRGDANGVARLGMAVAQAIDSSAPSVPGLQAETLALAATIAQSLLAAERPLVVSGTNLGSPAVLEAAANIVAALAKAKRQPWITLVFAESNSVGAGMLGGQSLESALKKMEAGEIDTAIVVENDLSRRVPAARLEAALSRVKNLVVLDYISNATTARASLLLPAGSFAESDGTLVNNEGRAQRFFQVYAAPKTELRESWRWLQDLALASGKDLGADLDELTAGCASATPALAGIVNAAPDSTFRLAGARIPRMSHRNSGRTAMNAALDVHEPRPVQDIDSPLAFSMEGAQGLGSRPAALNPMVWSPGWNSPQAVNKFQDEIGGRLRGGDPGVLLFKPDASGASYANPTLESPSGLKAVSLPHIFGSEELSSQAPVMASRIAVASLTVHPATAAKARLVEGARATLSSKGATLTLPVTIDPGFAEDCVGVPSGFSGVPFLASGSDVTLERT